MAAKIIYDSFEEIPEPIRPRASKTDSGYEIDAMPLLQKHTELAKEVQKFRATADQLTQERDQILKQAAEQTITNAITGAGGNPLFLRPYIANHVKPEVVGGKIVLAVLDDGGEKRRDIATGRPLLIEDLIQEYKMMPDFEAAFRAADAPTTTATAVAQASTPQFQPSTQKIRLTREQAKDARIYREALQKVGGRVDLIEFEPWRPRV